MANRSAEALELAPRGLSRPWTVVHVPGRLLRFAVRYPLGGFGMVAILLLIVTAVLAPEIAPHSPYVVAGKLRLLHPSRAYLFGTDDLGRDLFSRVVYGSRISIAVGAISVGVSVLFGMTIGMCSGYFGGVADMLLQRFVDTVMAFPGLVLALTLVAMLGQTITNIMIAVGIAMAPGMARVVRGAVIAVRANAYLEAAEVIGAGHVRILLKHILPNILAPVLVLATAGFGGAILAEGSLSFLGLGTPPPTPSWGGMLSGSSRTYMEQAPWLAIFPGVAITIAVLAFNLLGDAIRDVLDPRLKSGR